jgi:hypothetical protein
VCMCVCVCVCARVEASRGVKRDVHGQESGTWTGWSRCDRYEEGCAVNERWLRKVGDCQVSARWIDS